jgi:hypothetical protein
MSCRDVNLEFGWMVLGVSWYPVMMYHLRIFRSMKFENGAARLFL